MPQQKLIAALYEKQVAVDALKQLKRANADECKTITDRCRSDLATVNDNFNVEHVSCSKRIHSAVVECIAIQNILNEHVCENSLRYFLIVSSFKNKWDHIILMLLIYLITYLIFVILCLVTDYCDLLVLVSIIVNFANSCVFFYTIFLLYFFTVCYCLLYYITLFRYVAETSS